MTDVKTQNQYRSPKPYPGLKCLNKLVGTWKVTGPVVDGQISFDWMDGGFFLIQNVDLIQDGQKVTGIQVIGYERGFGARKPSDDIKAHWFDNMGDTFLYTYEVNDDTLIIWGGDKGSPAYYKGVWSNGGNTNSGAWHYPDGGGYESTMTRIK